ncbi:hypothetical protein PENSPDRAFT_165979 [Peniophora sp. CONT]|nr:hypothetical protein PENSPDRAFT_165979 [Peniophora sp. CONT]
MEGKVCRVQIILRVHSVSPGHGRGFLALAITYSPGYAHAMLDESIEHLAIDELDGKEAAVQHWSRVFRSRTAPLVNPPRSLRTSPLLMQKWDDELEGLARQMHAARQYRNSHALPCLLPAEVLENVFEYLSVIDPINALTRGWGWGRVTHVCRRFRMVALEHGKLWADLSVNGDSNLWNILLPRSRNAPLSIRGNMNLVLRAKWSFCVERIVENFARIRVLDLTRVPYQDGPMDAWLRIPIAEAPELQYFGLDFLPRDLPDDTDIEEPALESHFFQTSPKLTTLRLSGIHMAWTVTSLIKLRSIEIRNRSLDEEVQYSFADIVLSLQHMPLLEVLHLHNALPVGGSFVTNTRVPLPNLRILLVDDTDKRCLCLWSSLVLPSTCSVYLEIETLQPEDDAKIHELVQEHLASVGRPAYKHIYIGDESHDDEVIRFAAHCARTTIPRTSRTDGEHQYNTNQQPVLAIAYQAMSRTEVLSTLLGLLPGGSVQTIRLSDPSHVFYSNLGDILCNFPHVTHIELVSESDDIFQLLAQKFLGLFVDGFMPHHSSADTAESVIERERFMPGLRVLHLNDVPLLQPSELTGRRFYDDLTEAFRRREAAGLSNPALKVTKSDLKESWVRAWEQFVKVDYDHTCEIKEEDYDDW